MRKAVLLSHDGRRSQDGGQGRAALRPELVVLQQKLLEIRQLGHARPERLDSVRCDLVAGEVEQHERLTVVEHQLRSGRLRQRKAEKDKLLCTVGPVHSPIRRPQPRPLRSSRGPSGSGSSSAACFGSKPRAP